MQLDYKGRLFNTYCESEKVSWEVLYKLLLEEVIGVKSTKK